MSYQKLRHAVLDLAKAAEQCPGVPTFVRCPECGDPSIGDFTAKSEDAFPIANHGVRLYIAWANGHIWQLRLSSWYLPHAQ